MINQKNQTNQTNQASQASQVEDKKHSRMKDFFASGLDAMQEEMNETTAKVLAAGDAALALMKTKVEELDKTVADKIAEKTVDIDRQLSEIKTQQDAHHIEAVAKQDELRRDINKLQANIQANSILLTTLDKRLGALDDTLDAAGKVLQKKK